MPLADDVVVADLGSIRSGTLLDVTEHRMDVPEMLRDLGMRIIDVTPEESVYPQRAIASVSAAGSRSATICATGCS